MKTTLTLLILLVCGTSYGQTATECINYEYDASGNRVLRKVILLPKRLKNEETPAALIAAEDDELGISDISKRNEKTLNTYEDMLGQTKLTISPNPTAGELKVEIPNLDGVNQGLIRVYDLNGRTIFEERVSNTTTTVDLSEQVNGTYILLLNINGKTSEWKVIKQN